MSRLKFLMNKKEQVSKKKRWMFVTICDTNNNSFKKFIPPVDEHFDRINELFEGFPASFVLCKSAYASGIQHKLGKKYFKTMDASLQTKMFGYNFHKKTFGGIKGEPIYVIDTFERLFLSTEYYEHNLSTVVIFGNTEELNMIAPLIDKVLLTRVNGDFQKMYPDEELCEPLNDNYIKTQALLNIHKIIESTKSKELEKIKSTSIKDQRVENLSDNIKISYSNKTLKDKQQALPRITSYHFEEITYNKIQDQDEYNVKLEGLKGKKKKEVVDTEYWFDRIWVNKVIKNINDYIRYVPSETNEDTISEETSNDSESIIS